MEFRAHIDTFHTLLIIVRPKILYSREHGSVKMF